MLKIVIFLFDWGHCDQKNFMVNKHAKVVCDVSFWYKANYWIFGVLAAPALIINRIRLKFSN